MTLEQLRIFVAVAEREHLTRAAQALNLSQSATSAAIAALETSHATQLFDRVGRRIALTEAGRLFLAEARAVLAQAAIAQKMLVDLAGLTRGTLALAASQTVGNYWLPAYVQRYRDLYPGIEVRVAIGNSDEVAARVLAGTADLGFVEGGLDDPALIAVPVAQDEMVLVAPVVHPWNWKPPHTAQALRAGPWVLREPGSGTRAMFEAYLATRGIAPGDLTIALEYPSNEAIRAAVEAGSGATVISRRVVDSALRAGTMALIDVKLPARPFLALRHRERSVTRAAQAFLDQVATG